MRFSARLPNDTATLLLLANFIIVHHRGLRSRSHDPASHARARASRTIGAVCLLAVYVVMGRARTCAATPRRRRRAQPGPRGRRSACRSTLLAIARRRRARSSSDWFIARAASPRSSSSASREAFAGLVIVAIAGNAVENATGIVLAAKGQSDLAISVVKNSVAQIAAFLFPVLVLISLLFTHHADVRARSRSTSARSR